MKAKVITTPKKVTTIDGVAVKVGDVVDVGECTFKNLARKGILEPVDSEAKAVDVDEPSVLTEAEAKENIIDLTKAREAKKAADEAKKRAA